MKKIFALLLAAMMLFALVACGGLSDTKSDKEQDETETTTETSNTKDDKDASEEKSLLALKGMPLVDAMLKFEELGYTATYFADGVEFTDFIDDLKEEYTTGELEIDTTAKTVKVDLELTSNIEQEEAGKALKEKLELGSSWIAVEKYGKQKFSDFELNYLLGKIDASPEDENTWFLKAECEVLGTKMTCEAKVTGTTENPEVIFFDVY